MKLRTWVMLMVGAAWIALLVCCVLSWQRALDAWWYVTLNSGRYEELVRIERDTGRTEVLRTGDSKWRQIAPRPPQD